MTTWPNITASMATDFEVPGAQVLISDGGKMVTNDHTARGRSFSETYVRNVKTDLRPLLAFVRKVFASGEAYSKSHPNYAAARGTASGTLSVLGASQTGLTLIVTSSIPNESGLLLAGDHINIAGSTLLFEVTEDLNMNATGSATMSLSPPILQTHEPADDAAITMTDASMSCKLIEPPEYPESGPNNYGVLTVVHREDF